MLPVASIVVPISATVPIVRVACAAKVQIDAWATVVAVQSVTIVPVAAVALVAMRMAPFPIVDALHAASGPSILNKFSYATY